MKKYILRLKIKLIYIKIKLEFIQCQQNMSKRKKKYIYSLPSKLDSFLDLVFNV